MRATEVDDFGIGKIEPPHSGWHSHADWGKMGSVILIPTADDQRLTAPWQKRGSRCPTGS